MRTPTAVSPTNPATPGRAAAASAASESERGSAPVAVSPVSPTSPPTPGRATAASPVSDAGSRGSLEARRKTDCAIPGSGDPRPTWVIGLEMGGAIPPSVVTPAGLSANGAPTIRRSNCDATDASATSDGPAPWMPPNASITGSTPAVPNKKAARSGGSCAHTNAMTSGTGATTTLRTGAPGSEVCCPVCPLELTVPCWVFAPPGVFFGFFASAETCCPVCWLELTAPCWVFAPPGVFFGFFASAETCCPVCWLELTAPCWVFAPPGAFFGFFASAETCCPVCWLELTAPCWVFAPPGAFFGFFTVPLSLCAAEPLESATATAPPAPPISRPAASTQTPAAKRKCDAATICSPSAQKTNRHDVCQTVVSLCIRVRAVNGSAQFWRFSNHQPTTSRAFAFVSIATAACRVSSKPEIVHPGLCKCGRRRCGRWKECWWIWRAGPWGCH